MHSSSTLNVFCLVLVIICLGFTNADEAKTGNGTNDGDLDVTPYNVREEGCPIVTERHKLNVTKLTGDWSMPFASLNWLADIGMALFNSSVKMSQITSICPKISIEHKHIGDSNATLTFIWKCPKLKGEFQLRCWSQSNVFSSKYLCWNDKENRDLYLMVGATDHNKWIVLVRCSPGEPGRPSEGMSWSILSKDITMDPDVADVLLGLLDGYGFNTDEFKIALPYDDCLVH